MKRLKTIIAVILVCLSFAAFCSCTGYRSVSLNVDKPEKVTFNMSDSLSMHVRK